MVELAGPCVAAKFAAPVAIWAICAWVARVSGARPRVVGRLTGGSVLNPASVMKAIFHCPCTRRNPRMYQGRSSVAVLIVCTSAMNDPSDEVLGTIGITRCNWCPAFGWLQPHNTNRTYEESIDWAAPISNEANPVASSRPITSSRSVHSSRTILVASA